jgi:hypothetical protein
MRLRTVAASALALVVVVAGRGTARLVTFLGLYWMAGGLITLRFALAVRPRRGARLGLVAGMAAVVGALLVLLRDRLAGLVHPDLLVELLGISAVLTGVLRVVGGFAAERRFGRRWTIGGIVRSRHAGPGSRLARAPPAWPRCAAASPPAAAVAAIPARRLHPGRQAWRSSCRCRR